MSVKETHDGAAFHMCSVILACREEFGRKSAEHDYNFLQNLLDESGISDKCKGLLEFEFAFNKYCLEKDDIVLKSEKVKVPSMLMSWKLNHEEEDYCSVLLKRRITVLFLLLAMQWCRHKPWLHSVR